MGVGGWATQTKGRLQVRLPRDHCRCAQVAGSVHPTPYVAFVVQELERMNHLLDAIRSSLSDCALGLRGQLTVSEQMDALLTAIDFGEVPRPWAALAYPSLQSLRPWIENLLLRVRQLELWSNDFVLPKSVCPTAPVGDDAAGWGKDPGVGGPGPSARTPGPSLGLGMREGGHRVVWQTVAKPVGDGWEGGWGLEAYNTVAVAVVGPRAGHFQGARAHHRLGKRATPADVVFSTLGGGGGARGSIEPPKTGRVREKGSIDRSLITYYKLWR